MNVMLKSVLELQLSIVHELRGDIEATLQLKEKLETLPLYCPGLVNSRIATNEIGADTSEVSSRPFEQKVTHGNNASFKLGIFESTCSEDMRTDIKTMQPPASDASIAKSYFARARAFKAKATRPTNDASNNLGDSNNFASPDQFRSKRHHPVLSTQMKIRDQQETRGKDTLSRKNPKKFKMKRMPESKRLWTKFLMRPTPTRIQRGLRLRYTLET
jgi:hypothetical protein